MQSAWNRRFNTMAQKDRDVNKNHNPQHPAYKSAQTRTARNEGVKKQAPRPMPRTGPSKRAC